MGKIFISCINSPLGQSIYEELRNDDVEPEDFHKFFATLDPTDDTPSPEGTYELISVSIT
jgi:hypothetical protein